MARWRRPPLTAEQEFKAARSRLAQEQRWKAQNGPVTKQGIILGPEQSDVAAEAPPLLPVLVAEDTDTQTVQAQMKALQAQTMALLEDASRRRDGRNALRTILAARQNLELLGKLAGELGPQTQVTVQQTIEVRYADGYTP